jgi:hypothetical protein
VSMVAAESAACRMSNRSATLCLLLGDLILI